MGGIKCSLEVKEENFASEQQLPTKAQLVQGLKGGKFEIDRDGLKGAENFSVHRGT
jgi:hypothetical protein